MDHHCGLWTQREWRLGWRLWPETLFEYNWWESIGV